MRVSRERVARLLLSAILLSASVIPILQGQIAYAAQITTRSLTLQTGAGGDGGSKPNGVVNDLYNMTIPGGSNVGSIQMLYCTTASGTCTTPVGLLTTNAGTAIGAQSGMGAAFTLDKSVNGAPFLTRTASTMTANSTASFRLDNVTNPTAPNTTFYVRVSTFLATNATGAPIDTGTVAASTANQIILTGTMPESLIFCTGGTVLTTAGIPDCTTATSGVISFNQLFSPTDTATATSQMAASTNATTGFNITLAGPTLTSGSNTIPAMAVAGVGARGSSQFGVNLKANTTTTSTPAVGTEVAPVANGTTLRGQAAAGYNTVDNFKFVSGDSVANSANGGAGPTNAQIYTASYIVNASGSQLAGTYTTTLTYVCTATF